MSQDPARPSFRIWIRRTVEPETSFSIQFTVSGARGLLAMARLGGTLESPAAIQGIETFLTNEEVRGTRFVVSTSQASIEEYLLAALGDGLLERLPEGYWVPLVPKTAGTVRLLLPRIPSTGDGTQTGDGLQTQPISRPDVRRALRDALAKAAGHVWEPAASDEEPDALSTLSPATHPVIVERPSEGHAAAPMEVEEDVVVFLGEESEDEAREGPAGRLGPQEGEEKTDPGAQRPVIPADLPPPPASESESGFGSRMSALVKFLRREQERDRAEISRLLARVAELEAQQALGAAPAATPPAAAEPTRRSSTSAKR